MSNYFCSICNRQFNNKLILPCSHEYCFCCINNYCDNKGYNCPECSIELSKNIFKVTSDDIKNILYINSTYWLYSAAYNSGWWCYDSRSNQRIEAIYNDYNDHENINFKSKVNIVKNLYNDNNFKEKKNNDNNTVNKNITQVPLSYKLKIGNSNYIINFDRMKQINKFNEQKQRNIRRVSIPENVSNSHKYLKNKFKVKGVSGIKYSKYNIIQ
jgi:hypothetical protein